MFSVSEVKPTELQSLLLNKKKVIAIVILLVAVISCLSTLDRNDAGYYTVIQSVTGKMSVRTTPLSLDLGVR